MKKYIIPTLLFIILASFTTAYCMLKPFAFTFTGRWQPTEDPLLIDDNGFQDIQNLRKDGKRLKGVSGHTKINTSVCSTDYEYPKNAFHFKKDQPSESHVIMYSTDSAGANGRLYQNTTAIPSAGNFSGTVLYTDDTSAGLGRFAQAPQGNVLYANGVESMIWGGDELLPVSFITSTAAITDTITNAKDYSNQVRNTLATADEVAVLGSGNDAECVLLMHYIGFDGSTTMPDSSIGGAHGNATVAGNAQCDTAQAMFGLSSLLLDGAGDYIHYADDADWFMSTGTFTIDFWVRFESLPATNSRMFFYGQRTDGVDQQILYLFNNAGTYQLKYLVVDTTPTIDFTKTWNTPVINQWYHIAIIRGWDGNANDFAITVNGTQVGTTETDADPVHDIGQPFEIGRKSDGTFYLNGWLDELRVTKGKARWTANFTPPSRAYAVNSNYWIVGSYRPLQGVKFYIGDANGAASTMTAWEWNGASWQSLSIGDNTDTGASLAQDGTVTWTATGEAKVKLLEGLLLYWYQFSIDAGNATIKTVTVDAPFQDIKNIWSGDTLPPIAFHVYDGGAWEDYTDHVNTPSSQAYSSADFAAELDDLTNTEYVYVGFANPVTALRVGMTEKANANAATITVYYWNGAAWVSVGTVTDETLIGGNALSASGYISWNPPNREEEFPQNLFGLTSKFISTISHEDYSGGSIFQSTYTEDVENELAEMKKKVRPLKNVSAYYYKLMWSATLSADVLVDTVKGIPNPKDVIGYKFPGYFRGRSWLFGEESGDKNKAIHSEFNAPDIWNGPDSGYLYFGNEESLTAYSTIYNLFKDVGIEQMIVTKAHETYRVTGDGPENWNVQRMSGNTGCIAPLSMVVAETAATTEGTIRQVAIWQSSSGVVMSDGATIIPISEDVKAYWDPNDSRYIPVARQDDSVGWYNPDLGVYKLLISSGSGQTTHNVELEYSLKYGEWTKLYRENSGGANPLQIGFPVRDTNGKAYTYGATNEGYMYRLENGKLWDTEAIAQYVKTKDLMLGGIMKHTVIDYIRVALEEKSTGATEDISIEHYCDQSSTATVDGTDDQAVPADIDMADGNFYTADCTLGECLTHAFKFSADMSTVNDGMELKGVGLYFETIETIIQ